GPVRLGVFEPDRQLLDGDSGFADTDIDAGGVCDRRRRLVAYALPGNRVIDGSQEVAHHLVHLIARRGDRIGGDAVGRGRGAEVWGPAVGAGGGINLTDTGAIGRRAGHLVPALIGAAVVLFGLPRPLVENFKAALRAAAHRE